MNPTHSTPTPRLVRPQEAVAFGESVLWLDVRTGAEFAEAHIASSLLLPLHELDASKLSSRVQGKEAILVVCRSGQRSLKAAEQLTGKGLPELRVLEGGIQAWESAGLALVRGKKVMSLERQVRIAAGSLVFLGAVLGAWVHPGWIALSGFVGAGLVFAGITDTCGMGMLIARMPWNQAAGGSEPAGEKRS
ncbi:MAG: rhodanese-like domain-containing protein [Blastochloris sp.]|nr:rhodanese-like domain-containing protein [Blastochloris sp.]